MAAKCKECVFWSHHGGGSCDYIGQMHQKRPCQAGEECTVFEAGKRRRQTSLPALSGKNRRRKLPVEQDLLEYIDALDNALVTVEKI